MQDTEITWEAPRQSRRGAPTGLSTVEFIEQFREHPGKWAVVRAGIAYADTTRQRDFIARGCEAVNRKQDDGTYTLYARWPEAS